MISSPSQARERSPDSRRLGPIELTPVHQRSSRRLRGEPPEFSPLPVSIGASASASGNATEMTTQTTPTHIVVNSPMTPEPFHGDTFEDAEDWLERFERVAEFNGWNGERKIRNVYFALEDSARTWFENHEATFVSWDAFRRELLATYPSTDRRERAEAALQARNQRNNESVAMYVEDMSRLFRRADPNMSEDKKLRHLMCGVKQELFAGLVRSPPRTVAEFRAEATTMESTLQQRSRMYNREMNITSVDTVPAVFGNSVDIIRELVRSVVREELQRLRLDQNAPTPSSLADLVREEVRQVVREPQLSAQPQVLRLRQPSVSYADVLRQTPARADVAATSSMNSSMPRNTLPLPERRFRKADVWRTPDRIPLCYHCGEAGHLYRMCHYRQAGLRGFPVNAPCPRNGERPSEIEEYLSTRQSSPYAYQQHQPRSAAPFRHRSPSPRPSSSSPRRRSQSPLREN
ncbi:uncharacterized protein LOC142566017 [Dermacentor variabilis]|uniref:uncharacterized protein LOC142566017 n=1 Tax=Dermacentor variabilis TaxID=34621 RepID=UPI003F5AEB83